jgi:hypothetical protein
MADLTQRQDLPTLYLVGLTQMNGPGRGLFHPPAGTDPSETDLVAWETHVEDWNGDDIVEASPPWFLATAAICEAIAEAGLTGLRVGAVAWVDWSQEDHVSRLAELAATDVPEFRVVVPEHAIDINAIGCSPADGIGIDDELRYGGWTGHDFARSGYGPVVTDRARRVIKSFRAEGCSFWPVTALPGTG